MKAMTDRERFHATFRYEDRDRSPICDFSFWEETLEVWKDQGLPAWVNRESADRYFGMDSYMTGCGVPLQLFPLFPTRVVEDRGDHEVVMQPNGVLVLRRKYMSSIPSHLGHTLTDRRSWKNHYLPRLDPWNPDRIPEDIEERLSYWQDPERAEPITVHVGSLFGVIRDWMGLEGVSYVVYDDPAWFEEMVESLCICTCGVLEDLFDRGAVFDSAHFWEDMCFNTGPLLHPDHFAQYLVPRYRRITDLLRRNGVEIIWVDCDGKIDSLIPLWMEGGVNCMFPLEVGTWGADPVALRQEYGRELLLMGGFDKHILARGKDAILREVERLTPLVEEGGFIGFCDHRVPPDVTLENYLYYLNEVRHRWGRDAHLKPLPGRLSEPLTPHA